MEVLGFGLAAIIGLSLGLLGGGGSILTVPIFVYVMGFGAKQAIAMSLPVVGATSLFGAASHWRSGNVRFRTAIFFGVVAMLGSYVGARMAAHVSGAVQLALLAVVMLAAAISMFRSKREATNMAEMQDRRRGQKLSVPLLASVGLLVGILTGLVGIGGGFLIVPALVVLARVPMKQAVGTSLLVIAMNSFSGFLGYVGRVEIPWGLLAVFTAIAIAGILVGTHLVRFVSQWALKRAFAAFLVLMGALILYQNRNVL